MTLTDAKYMADNIYKIGYARVSKSEQMEDSNAATQQIARLMKAGCSEIFFDVQSGRDNDRPEFEKLMQRVRSRDRCDVVVITRDDRITRSGLTSLQLLQEFNQLGIKLEILDAGGVTNLDNPYEWKQRAQAGIDAEFESRMLSMRVCKGYEYLRDQHKANPRVPFGYVRDKEQYRLDPNLVDIASCCIAAFFEARSLQGACRLIFERCGIVRSANGLRDWLLNPVLLGHTPYHKITKTKYKLIVYNTHSDNALLTESQATEIRRILKENKNYWGNNRGKRIFPLSGLIMCGECGSNVTVAGGGTSTQSYYSCRKRRENTLFCSQSMFIRVEELEEAVITELVKKAAAITAIASSVSIYETPDLQDLREKLRRVEILGDDPDVADLRSKLIARIHNLEQEQHLGQIVQSENVQTLVNTFSEIDYWQDTPRELKRPIYQTLVNKIVIKNGQVLSITLKV
ncbi:recombinase family protein [Aetokthonos hydrillicola Thurmond2011]|jgi:DNA invertase Pin-like site-specific DNA recombinase|uniref:Recombinase family protein n=1 Tax=Aetokthonos hydrillicola Thurmond2011 TaxID=2712845 RepID=A0AAP5ME86_9CYAN|nr:fdxN element excision recombinase XisF [Aetokthonos hydrillicola]MBO3459933.1 recombinase family protein [Aetokthonos hydrillicola CCALA 1050]MBW4584051.1 recombinase family protein [Aetokthonos hydrillicola CCALA 1050]MDR9900693.1 recombinase family protein [Aetokthonos hydrillicola Thurmond2011]